MGSNQMDSRRRSWVSAATASAVVLLGLPATLLLAPPAQALGQQTTWLVSQTPSAATAPSMSADGRHVAYTAAGALVPADTNGRTDVYLATAAPGATPYAGAPVLVSADRDGGPADGASGEPAVSADGRYVAFTSDAPDLVAGADSPFRDVYVRDTRTGSTRRVAGGAVPDGASSDPAVSNDGRLVVFASDASNLVPGDTNGVSDVFVHDRSAGTITRVSVAEGGAQLDGASYGPAISGDGSTIAFTSENDGLDATPTADPGSTYAWHRRVEGGAPVLTRIGEPGDHGSGAVSLSGDGGVVAYVSAQPARHGVTGLGTRPKVFVESLTGHWEWVSDGLAGNVDVSSPSLSADGSTVAFTAGTLVRVAETEARYGAGGAGYDGVAAPSLVPTGSSAPSTSATGRTVALASTGSLPGDTSDRTVDVAVVGTAAGDQALHPALDSLAGLRKPAPLPFVDPARIPASATFVEPGPATAGATRIGATRIGATRIGATRIGATRIGATRIGATRIGATRIGATRIGATRIGATRIGDLPLTEWPLVSSGGWKVLLAGTAFEGLPLASVTLNQVLDWAAAHPEHPSSTRILSLTLGDFAPDAAFGALTIVALLLLDAPLSRVPVPGDPQAGNLANWRTAVAAQGFDPAVVTEGTALLDLDGLGVDIDLTGVGGVQARTLDPAGTAMPSIKVVHLSLENPLGGVRLAELPAGVLAAVTDCAAPDACGDGTLAGAVAAGRVRPDASLGVLVPGLPARITLDEVVRSLLDPIDFPWENLGWDALGAGRYNIPTAPAPGERTGITEVARYRAGFDTGPGGAAQVTDAVLEVELPPGTAFHDATLTATGPLAYVTPYAQGSREAEAVSGLVRLHLGDVPTGTTVTISVRATDATNFAQDDPLRGVLRSSTGQDDATTTLQGYAGYDQLVDPAEGDSPGTAPVLDVPNRIYFGGITASGPGAEPDVDYVRIARPGPGKRLILASGTVGPQVDVGIFQLSGAERDPANGGSPDARNLAASPLLEDDPGGIGSGHLLPAPLNIWDEPGWSLLDSSTHTGTQEEIVTVDGDGRGGDLLVRIQAADGQASPRPYTLRYGFVDVAPEQRCAPYQPKHAGIPLLDGGLTPPVILPGTNTIFLVDQKRLAQEYGTLVSLDTLSLVDAGTWVVQALQDLDGQFGVRSAVIPITGLDPLDLHRTSAVVAARARLDRNPCSASASNDLARAISDQLATYLPTEQARADVKNVVLVGGDDQIPFWRLPGGTFGARETDNEATLRLAADRGTSCDPAVQPGLPCDLRATPLSAAAAGDFVLTDDAYGDVRPTSVLDRDLYVPERAVARLVETPEDIRGAVHTFLERGGKLQTGSALSAGYGAWDEVPDLLVEALLGRVPGEQHQTLRGAWTRDDLTSRLFPNGESPRLVSINAHMSEDALLPGQPGATTAVPDRADLYTTGDLPPDWRARLAGRLLYTIGCHAGQALPDSWYGAENLDFAEAFSTGPYVGNTGWGVADDAATAMSERLLVEYARALDRPGTTAGQALAEAKQSYLEGLGLFMGYDEKVLMQSTFYGLPMYTLEGAGRTPADDGPGWSDESDHGLTSRTSTFVPDFLTRTGPGGDWQQADGEEPVVSPGNPILARITGTVPEVAGQAPHGALVTSLDTTAITGPVAVAGESLGGRVLTDRVDDIAFPSSLASVAGRTLTLIGSRVDANSTASATEGRTERFDRIGVRAYYSASDDHVEPFVSSTAERTGTSGQTITVRARDDGGQTLAAYLMVSRNGGDWSGSWMATEGSDLYRATIDCVGDVRWFVQVVDGAGNVGIDMQRGYFGQCSQAAPEFDVGGAATVVENTEFVRLTGTITDADSDRFTGIFDFGTGPQEMEVVKGPDGAFRAVIQVAGLHAGTYDVVVEVCDDSGRCSERTFTLEVVPANTAPQATVVLDTTNPVPDQTLVATAEGTDADGDDVTLTYQWYLEGTPISGAGSPTLDLSTVEGLAPGDTVTVTVVPDDGRLRGGGASASAVVRLNTAPVVDAGPDVAGVEGSVVASQGSVSDPDGDAITSAVVDYGDGSPLQDLTVAAGTFPLAHTYADDGTYTVTVTATDRHGGTSTDAALVTVANVAPSILPVTSPAPPVESGTPTTISVGWTDPGAVDTHTVTVDWGDGTTSAASVDPVTRTATASHTYTSAGTYVIGVTVTDDDGGVTSVSPYDFGVVFDPTAGYVTANGYYDSPPGAWPIRPDASGQAEFGLNARYTAGSTVPTGKLRFTYDISPEDRGCDPATCLELDSTDYSSLVVSGSTATLRGTGRLNGVSGHTFVVSVTDGPTDLVRVRILNRQRKVVYDSQPGAPESAAPSSPVGGGSVLLKKAT